MLPNFNWLLVIIIIVQIINIILHTRMDKKAGIILALNNLTLLLIIAVLAIEQGYLADEYNVTSMPAVVLALIASGVIVLVHFFVTLYAFDKETNWLIL